MHLDLSAGAGWAIGALGAELAVAVEEVLATLGDVSRVVVVVCRIACALLAAAFGANCHGMPLPALQVDCRRGGSIEVAAVDALSTARVVGSRQAEDKAAGETSPLPIAAGEALAGLATSGRRRRGSHR